MSKYQEALDIKFEKSHIIDLHLDKFPKAQMALYDNEEFKEIINKTEEFSNKYKQATADALQELVDLANVLEEYNVTPQNIRAVLMVGQMFIDKETNILEQLEKLKAAIKILRYEIGFDFLVDSNGVIAMEVLNGACLLKTEQYQLLKEVLNEQ